MSKKIVMIGKGSYANTLIYYISNFTDWEIVAFADSYADSDSMYEGKPYINIDKITSFYPPQNYEIVLAIGYREMNNFRKKFYEKLKKDGYSFPNFIHPTAILNNAKIGDANVILENVVVLPNTIIENNIIMWSNVLIGHDSLVKSHSHFAACSLVAGNTIIGENCFLGNHSTLKDGGILADYTLLGAGVFCSKNTDKYDVIVPARAVKLENHKSIDLI